jgi:uncharacterized repeat protein (TIGR01451 family)
MSPPALRRLRLGIASVLAILGGCLGTTLAVASAPGTAGAPAASPTFGSTSTTSSSTPSTTTTTTPPPTTTTTRPSAAPVADPIPQAVGAAFTCPVSTVFLSSGSASSTQLFTSAYTAGNINFTPLGPASSTGYNAMGFNPNNNYLYAVTWQGNQLLQIDATGTATNLGTVTNLPNPSLLQQRYTSGAFDPSGTLWVGGDATTNLTTIYGINVTTRVATPLTLSRAWTPWDMTYMGGFMWGLAGTTIYRLNLANGTVSTFNAPSGVTSGNFGAAWTLGSLTSGQLSFANNDTHDDWQISVTNPAATTPTFSLVARYTSPTNTVSDGTSCISQPADLSITKTGPATVSPSGPISWTLTVTNNGPGNASGFSVSDQVPAGVTNITSPTLGCTVSGSVVTCSLGALANGASTTITVSGTAPPSNGTCVTNTATVTGNETDPNAANNSASFQTCTTPGISLTKSANVTSFSAPGTVITYSYLVTNTSTNSPLHNITVTDPMPGLSAITCPPGTLSPGSSVTCTATYTTTQADVDRGFITNTGTASGTPNSGPAVSAQDSLRIPAVQTPSITINKSPSIGAFSAPGVPITYTYTVRNTGNVTLTAVGVTDAMPGLSAISCTPTAPATLAPGATQTCTANYTTTQADVDRGFVNNTGNVVGTPPAGLPNVSDQASVVIRATQTPNMTMVKSASIGSFSSANTPITYTYLVRNTGNVTLHNVGVTDPLPGLSLVHCPTTTLAPGASESCTATYLTTQEDVDAGSVFNTGTASGAAPDGTVLTRQSSVTVPATQTAKIALVKSASVPSFAAAGVLVTYSYKVTNTGNVTLSPVNVTDPMSGLSTVNCPETSLAPGESQTCTATYTTRQSDVNSGSITNTGTATGTAPSGATVEAESSATVDAVQSAAIGLVKSADLPQFSSAGTTITYSYLVTNAGNVTLNPVTVSDSVLGPITCPLTRLSPGQNETCTATYHTTQADVDRGFVTNVATATGTPPSGPAVTKTATETVDAVQNPAIKIVKTASPTSFDAPGTVITYSYRVTNSGNVTLHSVVVSDGAPGLSAIDCPSTTLAPGASMTCTATHITTQTDVDRGSITNTGTATGTPPTGPALPPASSSDTVPAVTNPKVAIAKTASPTSFDAPGTVITYSYRVTNSGNVTLDPVTVTDPMPGLSSIHCPSSTLTPGASMTCTATYTTTQADVDRGSITNTGTATALAPDGTTTNNKSTDTVPSVANPAITLAKSSDPSTFTSAGAKITYSYHVTNTGNVTLDPVTVTDPMPGLSTLTCPQSSLAPSDSMTCTASYFTTQADLDRGTITNLGTATGTAPDGATVIDTAPDTVRASQTPSIALNKTAGPDSFSDAGMVITYSYTVENTGNVTLNPVTVTDPMPGLSAISCPSSSLAPGVQFICTATYTTTQTDVDNGSITNVGTAAGTAPNGTVVRDSDSMIVTVVQAPAIGIVKTPSITEFSSVGTEITYTYHVLNSGNVTLNPVTVDDSVIGPVTCPSPSLAPGADEICTATYSTTQADLDRGFVTNGATATGTAPDGTDVDRTATATVTAEQTPRIDLVKSADVAMFSEPGTVITYSYLVKNTGNVTLDPVTVTDPMPGLSAIDCPNTALTPGDSEVCTATYTTTQADVDFGSITNTGTAEGLPPSGTPVHSDGSTVTVPADQRPSITLTKSANITGFSTPSTPVTYSYLVKNTGNVTLDPVTVTDPMPGLSAVLCPFTALAPGDSETCTATHTTTQADVDRGSIANTGTATGRAPDGATVDGSGSVRIPADQSPDISIAKNADMTSFDAADTQIHYSYLVTNTGNVTLSPVTVTDPMPGLSSITCPQQALSPGDFMTCTGTYTTTQADVDRGSIVNTGTAKGTAPDGTLVDETSTLRLPAVSEPAVTLKKTGLPAQFTAAGTTITFTYTVINAGNVTLHNVGVTDPLPGLSSIVCPTTELAPGDQVACTATYVTTQTDVDRGFVTNTGTVEATAPDGTVVDDHAMLTVPAVQRPAISVLKTADVPSFAAAGVRITYSYKVTNTGNVSLSAVDVTDPMPGLSSVACPDPVLGPGDSETCTATYTTTQADVNRGSIVNTGTAHGSAPDGTVVHDESTATVEAVQSAAIGLVKSADVNEFDAPGTLVTYSYQVTNAGNVDLDPVTVTDPLPGLSAIDCPTTVLGPGQLMTCTATYTTTQADVDRGFITNLATASGTPPSGPAVTRQSSVTIPAVQSPAVTILKTSSPSSFDAAGAVITYSYEVKNTGNVTLDPVTVTDPMPGLSAIDCPHTSLAPGASQTCTATYTTTQADVDRGSITNTGTVDATAPDGTVESESSSDTVPALPNPAVTILKTSSPSSFDAAGAVITYSYEVMNSGNVTLDPVTVTDPMPGLSAIDCPHASLAPGASQTCTATYTTTQADVDRGSITNTGTVDATAPDGTITTEESTDTVPAVSRPAVTIFKSASPSTFTAAGTEIIYSYEVKNTGNVTLDPVTVTDPMPGLSPIDCPHTSLAPGVSQTCTATYTTTQADVDRGSITNTGTVDATAPDGTITTEESTDTVPAPHIPSIDITKVPGAQTFSSAGDTITYLYIVTNTGNVTLDPVTVSDPMPGLSAIDCPETALGPAESMTCTATYTTTQADVDRGSITNTGTAQGTAPDGTVVDHSDTVTIPQVQAPAIGIAKVADITQFAAPGTDITYTYTVANTGNVTLDPVTVSDSVIGPVTCPDTSLAPTATMTCTATYITTQADVDRGFVTNAVVATGVPPSGPNVNDNSSVTVDADQDPAMTLQKSASPSTFSLPGTVITYRYLVQNTGNVTLDPVTVTDPMAGLSAISCPDTVLGPGDSQTCTATYTTTQADVDRGSITNVARTTGTAPDGSTTDDSSSDTVPATQNPGITISKSADLTDFSAPSTVITYSYLVRNTGNVTLDPVTVTDPMAGLSAISCPDTVLGPGDSQTCTATYTTTQADVDRGSISNTGTVTAIAPDGSTARDSSSDTVPAVQSPDISITKSADVTSIDAAGLQIRYSYLVHNTGNVTLDPVTVTDPMSGLSTITCPHGSLSPGGFQTCTATYTTTQADVDRGSISNTGTATGTAPDGTDVTASDPLTVDADQHPAISLEKTGLPPDFPSAGDIITYTYRVINSGNVTLTAVGVVDDKIPVPPGVSCPETTLAPGQEEICTATYTTTQTDVDNGQVTNAATVTGTEPDGTQVTDDASETLPLLQRPGLLIVKSASLPSFEAAGQVITYSYDVTNTGNTTLTDVGVADPMPGLSPISCTPTAPAILVPGATQRCTATYTTTQADVARGTITNTGTVTGTAPNGNPVTDGDTVDIPLAAVSITKSADVANFTSPGTDITYTYDVRNSGNATLTDVGVTDPMPGLSAISCIPTAPATLAPGATQRCTATYTTTQADVDRGSIANTGTVTGTAPSGAAVTASSSHTIAATQTNAVNIVKSASPEDFVTGTVITYTYFVTNTGNTTITDVGVTDPMSGLSPITCEAPSPPPVIDQTTLSPGQDQTCTATYTATAVDEERGFIVNTGTATGTAPDGTVITDASTLEIPPPKIEISKTAAPTGFTKAGEKITYTYTVTNTGTPPLHDVTVRDPMVGLSPISCTPTSPATLAPGATQHCTATYTTTQADVQRESITNTATASGTGPGGTTATATATATVHGLPAIHLVKSASPTSFSSAGTVVTYRLTVSNTGARKLDNVKIADPLPGLSAISCPGTSLAVGSSMTCSATYRTTAQDVGRGTVKNTATASSSDPGSPEVTSTSTVIIPLIATEPGNQPTAPGVSTSPGASVAVAPTSPITPSRIPVTG